MPSLYSCYPEPDTQSGTPSHDLCKPWYHNAKTSPQPPPQLPSRYEILFKGNSAFICRNLSHPPSSSILATAALKDGLYRLEGHATPNDFNHLTRITEFFPQRKSASPSNPSPYKRIHMALLSWTRPHGSCSFSFFSDAATQAGAHSSLSTPSTNTHHTAYAESLRTMQRNTSHIPSKSSTHTIISFPWQRSHTHLRKM